jgi:succinyl-CoA synthetase alpha subunit
MKSILPLFFLLSTSFAHAAEWTQADTAREVTYQVIAAMDWMQTRYISKHHATTLCGPNLPGCVVPSRDCGFYPRRVAVWFPDRSICSPMC